MIRETSAQAAPGSLTGQPLRRLTPPESGLIFVACAISKGTTEIDYIGPEAVFETWYRDPVTQKPAPRFKVVTVSESLDPADGRIPDYTFDTVPHPNIVIVPAQSGSSALHDWLKKIYPTTDVTMSVCIGARHLASAGLLAGKPATTHHEAITAFEKEYPDVHWVRGVRFVETDKISTGGGLTAGIDLALHVVERYFGRDAALGVADHLEYEGKRWMTS
jgi:transcriptional regulator GlxA family with amidase domain